MFNFINKIIYLYSTTLIISGLYAWKILGLKNPLLLRLSALAGVRFRPSERIEIRVPPTFQNIDYD
jgi:hypothetical protein